jgi:hypothetical protein
MEKQRLTTPTARKWTRPQDYFQSLALRRTQRRNRDTLTARTEPEVPRALLSTIPFVALLGALAFLSVAIMVTAWPGATPQPQDRRIAVHEQGVAARGWFQEAQKQFH